MNFQDIAALEEKFGVKLPRDYIRVITGEVAQNLAAVALEINPAIVGEANEAHRQDCPWDFEWDPSFWWIGEDNAGGFYFLDTAEDTSTVYYFDHESSPISFRDRDPFFPSDIGNHVSDEVEAEAYREKHDNLMLQRVADRRWWQFWIPITWPPTKQKEG